MPLVIRAMVAADIPRVVAIESSSALFPWAEQSFRYCLDTGCICQTAVLDGAVVGFNFARLEQDDRVHLLNLGVDSGYRGNGIGRTLLAEIIAFACLADAREIYLEVRPSNAVAINLYRSVGFQQVGRIRDYYPALGAREDGAVFRLPLNS
jgi:[ribosomal protein S18]-alanine N-acetyltransferase